MRRVLTSLVRPYSTQRLLVTGAGPERQGILKEMTRIVWEDNGNVINSQMNRLAGELTVMMLVEVPEEKVVDVQFKLSQQLLGLNVSSRQVTDLLPSVSNSSRLEVTGADNIETLQQVARFLSQWDVSLTDVATLVSSAPMGGAQLFTLQGQAHVPDTVDRMELLKELKKLEDQLEVEVSLSDSEE